MKFSTRISNSRYAHSCHTDRHEHLDKQTNQSSVKLIFKKEALLRIEVTNYITEELTSTSKSTSLTKTHQSLVLLTQSLDDKRSLLAFLCLLLLLRFVDEVTRIMITINELHFDNNHGRNKTN
jgi:hypothetical protein